MIRKIIAAGQTAMSDDDVEKCQRIFFQVCAAKGIKTRSERDSLASQILKLYQGGISAEREMLKNIA